MMQIGAQIGGQAQASRDLQVPAMMAQQEKALNVLLEVIADLERRLLPVCISNVVAPIQGTQEQCVKVPQQRCQIASLLSDRNAGIEEATLRLQALMRDLEI